MPLHDWSKAPAGLYHHFHQDWTAQLTRTLNRGLLPSCVSALIEQRAGKREDDIIVAESIDYQTNRIALKLDLDRTLAIIEVVSPGNKDSRAAIVDFVQKRTSF
jgi:hypothetical protein